MTDTVTHSPWAGGPAADGAQHALTGTALHTFLQGQKGNTGWNPTPECHPGICFIAALWSVAAVAFSGITQECRKLPLKSHCSKWSAQMPRWWIPVSGSLSSHPWGGLRGRDGCTCHWVFTDLLQSHQNTVLMEPNFYIEKSENLFNINFYVFVPSFSQTSDAELT